MKDDLISREALINAKPEFMNEKVVRDTKYRTTKDRIYAKAWNACNSYWLDTIDNASTVEPVKQCKFCKHWGDKDYCSDCHSYHSLFEYHSRPQGEWIPVSERLPEIGKAVLCQCQANIFEVLKLTNDGWLHDNRHCYMMFFVIAWMPLPNPYKEVEDENNSRN